MLSCVAEHLELLDGGGALQVGGDQQRLAAHLSRRLSASLPAGRRLAAALQAAQHQDGRPVLGEVEA